MRALATLQRHCPRKRAIQYALRDIEAWSTGSSAFADDDTGGVGTPAASPPPHGLKIDTHSARIFCNSAVDSFSQSIGITFRLSIGGAYSGSGLLKPARPEISASPFTRIAWPCSESTKSIHSLAAFGCGAFLRMNMFCGSSTTPSAGKTNFNV